MASKSNDTPASIASPAENAKLKHSDESAPATTRDDRLDAGVPMKPVPASEREGYDHPGPEDAMGLEPTRGDYSGRIDSGPHAASVPTSSDVRAGETVHVNADGEQVDKPAKGGASFTEPGPSAALVEQGAASPSGPGVASEASE